MNQLVRYQVIYIVYLKAFNVQCNISDFVLKVVKTNKPDLNFLPR